MSNIDALIGFSAKDNKRGSLMNFYNREDPEFTYDADGNLQDPLDAQDAYDANLAYAYKEVRDPTVDWVLDINSDTNTAPDL